MHRRSIRRRRGPVPLHRCPRFGVRCRKGPHSTGAEPRRKGAGDGAGGGGLGSAGSGTARRTAPVYLSPPFPTQSHCGGTCRGGSEVGGVMPQSTRRLGRFGVPWGRHECGLRPERVHILDAPRARVGPRSRGPTWRVRVRPRTRRGRVAGPTGGVFGSLPLFRRVFVGLGGLFGHFSIITLYTTFIGVLARCVCGCRGEAQGCAGVVRRDTPSRAAAVGCCPSAAVGASRPFARDAPRGCDAASHDVGRGGWGPVPTARTSLGAAPVVRCAPERRVLRTASAPVPPPRPAPAQRHGQQPRHRDGRPPE